MLTPLDLVELDLGCRAAESTCAHARVGAAGAATAGEAQEHRNKENPHLSKPSRGAPRPAVRAIKVECPPGADSFNAVVHEAA